MHNFKRSLAHFSIKSLISRPGWTHEVKRGMFFYLSHRYFFFSCPLCCPPRDSTRLHASPPATANAADTKTNTPLCWISHVVRGRNYFLLRSHPHPPRRGPVPMPEKTKPNCGKRGRRKMGRSQASSRIRPLPPHTVSSPPPASSTHRTPPEPG